MKVCLAANAYGALGQGGHVSVYLNWALGLRSIDCEVVWLEFAEPNDSPVAIRRKVSLLKQALAPYGLDDSVAVASSIGEPIDGQGMWQPVESVAEVDLLLTLSYTPRSMIPGRARSAMVDIDPGLTQFWISRGWLRIDGYDAYYSIGETVGRPGAVGRDAGIEWRYTRPCVALDWWQPRTAPSGAAFTTVSNWSSGDWVEDMDGWYCNSKREGFLPYLNLPRMTSQPLELALSLGGADEEDERTQLEQLGWRVVPASEVSGSPASYHEYIGRSLGEFSCAKPSCIRFRNAWISDRTLCYLASGKPAVVQHTGPSAYLPDEGGLFRFRTPAEAARQLDTVAADYAAQSVLARRLAEEFFDARVVLQRLVGEVAA